MTMAAIMGGAVLVLVVAGGDWYVKQKLGSLGKHLPAAFEHCPSTFAQGTPSRVERWEDEKGFERIAKAVKIPRPRG